MSKQMEELPEELKEPLKKLPVKKLSDGFYTYPPSVFDRDRKTLEQQIIKHKGENKK